MGVVDVLGMAASSFGVAMGSAPLLQARTIWRRRSADDVSQAFLAIIAFGAFLWALYGLADRNWFIVVPNVVGVATNLLTLQLARRFAGPRRADDGRTPGVRPTSAAGDPHAS